MKKIALVLAVFFVGCGSQTSPGGTIKAMHKEVCDKNDMLAMLPYSSREMAAESAIALSLAKAFVSDSDLKEKCKTGAFKIEIVSEKIVGEKAEVVTKDATGDIKTVYMVKEDGKWKMSKSGGATSVKSSSVPQGTCQATVIKETTSVEDDGSTKQCEDRLNIKGEKFRDCPPVKNVGEIFQVSQKWNNQKSGNPAVCEKGGYCWAQRDLNLEGDCVPPYISIQ